jgi:hypothetical protein
MRDVFHCGILRKRKRKGMMEKEIDGEGEKEGGGGSTMIVLPIGLNSSISSNFITTNSSNGSQQHRNHSSGESYLQSKRKVWRRAKQRAMRMWETKRSYI